MKYVPSISSEKLIRELCKTVIQNDGKMKENKSYCGEICCMEDECPFAIGKEFKCHLKKEDNITIANNYLSR